MKNGSFTWGDVVTVRSDVPKDFHPGQAGSICGIRAIETEKISNQFLEPIGTILYIVEFPDGNSVEIPEKFLSEIGTE